MKRGLTLLETIVILVIVALPAAVLLPFFSRLRAHDRIVTCASNLQKIGVALSLYSAVPTHGTFPTNNANGRGDPLPSLGMLYRDYATDYRIFSCPSNSTEWALADLRPTAGAARSTAPLTSSMTHYGYDSGNKGTNYAPHTAQDTVAIVVADFTAAGRNSSNHAASQNVLRASGLVEWTDTLVNPVSQQPAVQDDDITADGTFADPKLARMKSYISQ